MKRYFILGLLCLLGPPILVSGQEIKITDIQQKGEEVTIKYNLLDERLERSYAIRLYTSRDNYIQPMELVKGDVGVDIPVGGNKAIIWKAKEELGADFSGGLNLELKGHVYVPFVELDGIEKGMIFKRGKSQDIVWFGGRGDNILSFELYRGERLIKTFDERPNTGNTKLIIPTNVKPGLDYRLRISDSKNRDEVVFTEQFEVRRKLPLALKLGLSFALGVATGIVIKKVTEPEHTIPDPPNLPSQ